MSGTQSTSIGDAKEAAQYTAYEKEREAKARLTPAKEGQQKADVTKLLQCVVEGEQDQAEALLKSYPYLAWQKGTIVDLSEREFKDITAFQYAVWALDWHMWQMLLKYLSKEAAALQYAELEEKETAHGKHFSLLPLIVALDSYVQHFDIWGTSKCKQHWCKVVGMNQWLLPVHVVNEYCYPLRPFYPCPKFDEREFRRSKRCGNSSWFVCKLNGGGLGEEFAIKRGASGTFRGARVTTNPDASDVAHDLNALCSLWKIRQQQLEALKVELHYLTGIKGLLNDYFPAELSSMTLKYVG